MNDIALFPTGKNRVSFSEFSDWDACTWRHYLKNVKHLCADQASPYLVFGRAVHIGCETFLKTGILDTEISTDLLRKEWDEATECSRHYSDVSYVNADKDEEDRKFTFSIKRKESLPTMDEYCETANKILVEVPDFINKSFPGWEYVAAEELLEEPIDGHDPVIFKGYIDAIISTPASAKKKKYFIIDFKTSGWGWNREKKSDFTLLAQLRLYKHFWALKHNIDPRDIKCGFMLLKRTGKTGKRCEIVPVSAGPVTVERSLHRVHSMISAVWAGFKLKNRNSCRWCDYHDTPHCECNPNCKWCK